MRGRARRSLPGLKAELRSKRKALRLSPPELPPFLPFVVLFTDLLIRLMVFHVLAADRPDFDWLLPPVACGLSVADLWGIIGILLGIYVVLNTFIFFKFHPERKFVGRVCAVGACLCAVGFQGLVYSIQRLPVEWAAERKVPLLAKALGEGGQSRFEILPILWAYGPRARSAAPQIVSVMETDSSPVVRGLAADTLAAVDPEGTLAIPALTKMLSEEQSPRVRCSVVGALARIDREAAAPPLINTLFHDKDAWVRQVAGKALERIGGRARAVLPALLKNIDDKDVPEDVREMLEKISRRKP